MNKAKDNSRNNGDNYLKNAFVYEQELLRVKIEFSQSSITHDPTMGEVNELHFIDVLRKYLPKRYEICKGIVIDCKGQTSDQIDVIIFDNQYTPTLLDQENHRFIPSEAVYAIFEVKPEINKKNLDYAGCKAESVRNLYRSSVKIPHAGGLYPPKPLFEIIAGIISLKVEWTDGFGETFINNWNKITNERKIDCGLSIMDGCFDSYDGDINKIYKGKDRTLIIFIFRLLQKLQSLGTVPAIDWNAYAENL